MIPSHTPYDGSAKPFTIGLNPLDLADWIEPDDHLHAYLAEKDRLHATRPDAVFVEEDGTRAAQDEILALLAAFLPLRFPGIWSRNDSAMTIAGAGANLPRIVDLGDEAIAPLNRAALLVQEDLVLMRKSADGWRLCAASVCFPSSWTLTKKFGLPLSDIHAPVPGFARGTRNAAVIDRIFDNLKVDQPVWRQNWAINADPALHHPFSELGAHAGRPEGADLLAVAFMRVERQTLRKLPRSGDILFTIRIHIDPLRALAAHADRASLAASLAGQLAALDEGQLAYKGMTNERDRLVTRLEALAKEI